MSSPQQIRVQAKYAAGSNDPNPNNNHSNTRSAAVAAAPSPTRVNIQQIIEPQKPVTCASRCRSFIVFICGLLTMIGLGLLIIGAIIPGLVKSAQETAITNSLPISSLSYSSEQWSEWKNSSTNTDFYFWNITNLNAALLTGVQLNIVAVGPIRTRKYYERFNIEENNIGTIIAYDELISYEIIDSGSEYLLTQPIVTINSAGLFNMGLAARQSAGSQRSNHTDHFKESKYIATIAGVTLLKDTIAPAFLSTAGSINNLLQLLLIYQYFKFAFDDSHIYTSIGGVAGSIKNEIYYYSNISYTSDQIKLQWASGGFYGPTEYYNNSFWLKQPNPAAPVSQQWNYALSSPYLGLSVLNSTNPYSPANPNGAIFWLSLINQISINPGSTATLLLINQAIAQLKYNNTIIPTVTDISNLALWIGTILLKSGTTYVRVVIFAITAIVQSLGWDSSYYPRNWNEIGALQWGTSLITKYTLLPSISYDSVIELLNSLVPGLGAAISLGKSQSIYDKPMELLAGIKYITGSSLYNIIRIGSWNNTNIGMTIANSTLLLESFQYSSNTNAARAYSNAVQSLIGFGTALTKYQLTNDSQYAPFGSVAQILYNSIPTTGTILLQSLGVNPTGSNSLAILIYFQQYLGSLLTGNKKSIDAYGIAPENNGIFIKRTIGQLFWGYQNGLGANTFTPAVASQWRTGSLPAVTMQSQYKALYPNFPGEDRRSILKTGRGDISSVGELLAYRGVASFRTGCELDDPYTKAKCSTAAARAIYDYQLWENLESLTGTRDTVNSPPFQESSPISSIKFYLPEISRVIETIYTNDVTVKNINVRRYTVNPEFFLYNYNGIGNELNNWKNDRNYYTGPKYGNYDGLILSLGTFGGSPLIISQPHMLDVDSRYATAYIGNNPNSDQHRTYLDADSITGKTFRLRKALQSNFRFRLSEYDLSDMLTGTINPFTGIPDHRGIFEYGINTGSNDRTIVLPYYYSIESAELSQSDADKYQTQILDVRIAAKRMQSGMCAGGAIMFALFALLVVLLRKKSPSINVNDTTMMMMEQLKQQSITNNQPQQQQQQQQQRRN